MMRRARDFIDLVAVVLLLSIATVIIGVGATGIVRIVVAIPLVTILPGYALLALLYPRSGTTNGRDFDENEHSMHHSTPEKRGITGVERLAFSVVSSPVVVALVALVSSFTPWGVTLGPILVGVVGLTVLFVLGAVVRQTQIEPSSRYTPSLGQTTTAFKRAGRTGHGTGVGRRVFTFALAGGVLLFVASLAFAAVTPPQTQTYTELYVESQNVTGETQSMYPSRFDDGQSRTLPVVVANHESVETDYSIVILLQRVEGAGNDARVIEQRRLAQRSLTVAQGGQQTVRFSISPSMSGTDLRLLVLLYRDNPPEVPSISNAYRSLRLPINVDSGGQSAAQSTEA